MALVQKNEIVEMKITGMTAQGAGVGHYQGMAVFTPLTAPGDVARVRVVKAAKNYAYGRLEELVSPSADRMEPDCPCFAQCGGCCYRHITYEAELGIKAARVQDALTRIGGFHSLPVHPILGADSRDGYRNKALLPLGTKKDGSLSMGFYAVNSHRIVDCEECRLQPEEFNRAMERLSGVGGRLRRSCVRRGNAFRKDAPAVPAQRGNDRPDFGLCGGQRQWAAPRNRAGTGPESRQCRGFPAWSSIPIGSGPMWP